MIIVQSKSVVIMQVMVLEIPGMLNMEKQDSENELQDSECFVSNHIVNGFISV